MGVENPAKGQLDNVGKFSLRSIYRGLQFTPVKAPWNYTQLILFIEGLN
jgi:hypothetical protein